MQLNNLNGCGNAADYKFLNIQRLERVRPGCNKERMENQMNEAKKPHAEKRGKNPTTNYAKDSHKAFCKRCFAYNGKCPRNGKDYADYDCTL